MLGKKMDKIPIISIVGKSNSGKTTVVEGLVLRLKKMGYKVGTIKHSVNDYEIDIEGRDSWRHRKAGADISAISSPNKISFIKEVSKDTSIDEIVSSYFNNLDIIITEGYKKEGKPKIEVSRREISDKLICDEDELLAVVSDNKVGVRVPRFDFEEPDLLAEFIEREFLMKGKE